MKSLFMTVSAAALLMTAAACSDAKTNAQTASHEPEVSETAAATPEQAQNEYADNYAATDKSDVKADQRAKFMLASNEVKASDLIGASVVNPAGEDVATVADIWLGEAGDEPKLIVREGGVAGVGGTLHAVSFDDAKIEPVAGDDEPDVRITYSEASLEGLPEFEQDGMDDFRLASEIMGTTASFAFNDEEGRINDFVLKRDGEPEYIVVADNIASPDQYVIDYDDLHVAQGDGDGTLTIDITADDYAMAKLLDDGK